MPFAVETDHKPLLAIMNTQSLVECPPRLVRLKFRMLRYCFTVEYVPGKKLVVADALSGAPIVTDESQQETTPSELLEEHISVITALLSASDLQLQRIREETEKDVRLAALLKILQSEWPAAKSQLNINAKPFWDTRHLFTLVDGLILRGAQMNIPQICAARCWSEHMRDI